jgi:4-amino-4-deoxy-L-arabinose transferase-like glycosyltransferase
VRNLAAAAALFVVIGLPWYAAMTYTHGAPYLESFFLGDNLERFATDRFNEPRGLWFYIPIVLGGLLPWTLFLFVMAPSAWDVFKRRRQLTPEEWRLLIWIGVPLLFFTLSVGKQPRYILPVLPPLAILVGRAIVRRIRDPRTYGPIAIATWATVFLFLVLAGLLVRARPLFVAVDPTVSLLAVALIVGAALALAYVPVSGRWHLLPGHLAVCAAALLIAVQFGALAGLRPEPVEQVAALVKSHTGAREALGTYQVFVRNLVFYTEAKTTDVFDDAQVVEFMQAPERRLMVLRATDLARLEAASGLTATKLGEVRYLNTANVRIGTVLAPIPDRDIETVVLVANR